MGTLTAVVQTQLFTDDVAVACTHYLRTKKHRILLYEALINYPTFYIHGFPFLTMYDIVWLKQRNSTILLLAYV